MGLHIYECIFLPLKRNGSGTLQRGHLEFVIKLAVRLVRWILAQDPFCLGSYDCLYNRQDKTSQVPSTCHRTYPTRDNECLNTT